MNRFNYEIYLSEYQSWWAYYNSYKLSYDALLKAVDEDNEYINRIAYPLLFMARHCLELGFKANIRYFSKYSEKSDYTNSDNHNLLKLFSAFKLHVNGAIDNFKAKYNVEVSK